jgi:hypothetical protein
MSDDLGALFRQGRLAVCELVDDDVAAVPVPATPGWEVHAVIAHLAGVMEDAMAANLAEAGSDPWTAAQVERARSKTLKRIFRSGEAKIPKLLRWASPQAWTTRPELGVDERSSAIGRAAPR